MFSTGSEFGVHSSTSFRTMLQHYYITYLRLLLEEVKQLVTCRYLREEVEGVEYLAVLESTHLHNISELYTPLTSNRTNVTQSESWVGNIILREVAFNSLHVSNTI